ncbi:MAG: shikimate kinase [Candidatus Neomarinimicrobiota bacterium]|nr:MAG: shikimate kinase [Candidatus Neomarinimicrobiota bacterium]
MKNLNKHIFLIGMMGSGKSSVGKILARDICSAFIDLDQEIINRSGKSIETIFNEEGEEIFRKLETETAFDLNMNEPSVVATGGGFPLNETNLTWMRELGKIVWLKSSSEIILKRIEHENRPLLPRPIKKEHIDSILNSRISVYKQADLFIDTDRYDPEQIAKEIEDKLI